MGLWGDGTGWGGSEEGGGWDIIWDSILGDDARPDFVEGEGGFGGDIVDIGGVIEEAVALIDDYVSQAINSAGQEAIMAEVDWYQISEDVLDGRDYIGNLIEEIGSEKYMAVSEIIDEGVSILQDTIDSAGLTTENKANIFVAVTALMDKGPPQYPGVLG